MVLGAFLGVAAGPAWATVGLSAAPSIPSGNSLRVGQSAVLETLTISNQSSPPEDTLPVTLGTITLVPSCTTFPSGADCPPGRTDPGVLRLSATGVGEAGTACAGTTFTIAVVDALQGKVQFTPSAPVVLGPASGSGNTTCVIDFTVDVVRMPAGDANPDASGIQTEQAGFAQGTATDQVTGSGSSSNQVTVSPGALPIATQVAPPAIGVGSPFQDTATLSPTAGAATPTGTVTFVVYPTGSSCDTSSVFSSTNPVDAAGTTAVSDPFTPTTQGGYDVIATYSGDANYGPTSTTCGDPGESVSVGPATVAVTTDVTPETIGLGSTFHDDATLGPAPAGVPAPTGTVTFNVYGPADPSCAAAPVFTSTDPLTASGTMAASSDFTPTGAGTYRVVASYSGDANYTASASLCADPAEAVTVSPAPLAIATQVAPASITLGANFQDTATLGPAVAGAAAPTGSVTFDVYGPGDPACTASPVLTSTNPVNAAGTSAASTNFFPTAAGTYQVIATYSGDANYQPSASVCSDPAESVTVNPAQPTLTTLATPAAIAVGGSFQDRATVGSPFEGAPPPTGTVTFDVYLNDSQCASSPVFSSTVPLVDSPSVTSGAFTAAAAGTYVVVATYSGDANYNSATSSCGDPSERVTVARTGLAIATQVAPTPIAVGGAFHDTATLSPPAGGGPPTGTVTFNVYAPADPTCAATPLFTSTNAVDPSGTTAVSSDFSPTAPGTYRVIASYSGDASYLASASTCADPAEAEVVGRASLPVATAVAPATIALGGAFHDTATVAPPAGGAPAPTGTVTFNVYGPSDPACASAPALTATAALSGGSATSSSFTPARTGAYRVVAAYGGDANYLPSASSCGDPGETVTVGRAPLVLATAVAPASLALGGSFADTASLGPVPAGAAAPSGSVTFQVYGPGDPTCAATPVFTSINPLGADGNSATSGRFTPSSAGTYRVIASYAGDADYTPSTSACADPAEAAAVGRATALALTTDAGPEAIALGASFNDAATLGPAPAGAAAPTGTVTFAVFGPADATCSAAPVFTSTNALTRGGTAAASDSFTPTLAGTYRVVATYSGDGNYPTSTTACADPTEAVVVSAPAPAVTGLSPISGPQAGGTTVTITGTGFAGATGVSFGGTPATAFTVTSPSQITATAPAGSGTVDVRVTTPAGTSPTTAPDAYAYVAPPTGPPLVTAVTPASGPAAGGNGVVISGTGFTGATSVHFGSAPAPVVGVSADGTQLTTVAPPGTGTVDVTVTTPSGTSTKGAADHYAYGTPLPAPAVTAISPTSGPAAGGTVVTITGTGLTGASFVRFGAAPAQFTVDGPTQITATAPAGTGTVDVTVTTPSGTSPAGAGDQFTYVGGSPGPPGPAGPSGPSGPTGTPRAATVVTGPPKVINSTSVEFSAVINPGGAPTTMHFEYTVASGAPATAAAVSYAATTPEQVVGSDFADHVVKAVVARLLPNSAYHVKAVASNALGVASGGDAAFQTAVDPPPGPPVLGKSVDAATVSGVVYVLVPGTGHVASAHTSAAKGVGFVPLTEARQLPVGTIFDTTSGVARLTTATATKGQTQAGNFGGGLFKLLQNRKERGLSELRLVLRSTAARRCAAGKVPKVGKVGQVGQAQTAAAKALPKTVLALLRANVKGKFRTRGRYSAATVRGTMWTTTDRCDGTLTAVQRGVVAVTNLRTRRQIVLRAGRSYLAKAP